MSKTRFNDDGDLYRYAIVVHGGVFGAESISAITYDAEDDGWLVEFGDDAPFGIWVSHKELIERVMPVLKRYLESKLKKKRDERAQTEAA